MCPNSQTAGVPVELFDYTHVHTWLEPTTVTWLFDLKWERGWGETQLRQCTGVFSVPGSRQTPLFPTPDQTKDKTEVKEPGAGVVAWLLKYPLFFKRI